jgi:hypothetical protein
MSSKRRTEQELSQIQRYKNVGRPFRVAENHQLRSLATNLLALPGQY